MNAEHFLAKMKTQLGIEMGTTAWMSYDQDQINAHGGLTGDDGPIHNDPVWAAKATGFGGTIVQGSLILSSFTRMAKSLDWPEGDIAYRMNYGFDRIRITAPVKTGQSFRGRFSLKDATPKNDKAILLTLDTTIEVQGGTKPAIAAVWLTYLQFNS